MSYTITLKAGRVFMHGNKYIAVLGDEQREDPPWIKIPVEAVEQGLVSVEEVVVDSEEAEDEAIRKAIAEHASAATAPAPAPAPVPAAKDALGSLGGMVDFTAMVENPIFRTGEQVSLYAITAEEAAKIDNALTVLSQEGGYDAHVKDILRHVASFQLKNLNEVRGSFSANNRRRIANYIESRQGARPPAGARPMLGPTLSAFVAGRDINPPGELSKLARPGAAPTEAQLQMARDEVASDKSALASLATRKSAIQSLKDIVPFTTNQS